MLAYPRTIMKRFIKLSLLTCLFLILALFIVGCGGNYLSGAAPVEITTVDEVYGEEDDEVGDEETDSEESEGGVEDENEGVTEGENNQGSDEETTGNETESGPQTHTVKMNDDGFSLTELKINVGHTVEWQNVRQGKLNQAMIMGMRECREVKSGLFNTGESFSWTFEEAGTCYIVDGIYTEEEMRIVVEE